MADEHSPLEREIRRLITVAGPMPVAEYMRLCLTHPQHGYYITHDPIGVSGDFVTAPEISQMFGELIGLWMISVWQQMGSPENVRIIELGPGHGSLMMDAFRAARIAKEFQSAAVLHLVEISPKLKEVQQKRMEALGMATLWHSALADVPGGPSIIVGNEFIDALPVHQAVKQGDGWHERVVELSSEGNFSIGAARDPLPHFEATLPPALRQAPTGSLYEWRSDTIAFEIARRVRAGGVALLIDYGHVRQGLGETLQAVAGHSFQDALHRPGEADLTAHVDFVAFAQNAEMVGVRAHGPVPQRDFLHRLGIERRAAALKARAPSDKVNDIDRALFRLTGTGPAGMGELFKVLAIADQRLGSLPGFET